MGLGCLLALGTIAAVSPSLPTTRLAPPLIAPGSDAVPSTVQSKLSDLAEDALRRADVPTPVAADDLGSKRVFASRTAYFNLDFKAAVSEADAAVRFFDAQPLAASNLSELVDAYVFGALASLELGDSAGAMDRLTRALVLRPRLSLPEADFSPTALAALERARDGLSKRPRGRLTLSSTPPLSRVLLDGNAVGETPVSLSDVLVGRHVVEVRKAGFDPAAKWVDVKVGANAVTVNLEESAAPKHLAAMGSAVETGGAGLGDAARSWAGAMGAEQALVLVIRAHAGRYTVTAVRAGAGEPVRAWTSFSTDLVDAPSSIDALIAAALGPGPGPISVGNPEPLPFDKAFTGFPPPLPSAPAAAVDLRPAPPAPLEPEPVALYQRPLFWVATVGAIAAAGAGTYFLTRPAPPPPGTSITLHLPQ